MERLFKILEIRIRRIMISEKQKTNPVSPPVVTVYCLERVSREWHRVPSGLFDWKRWSWKSEDAEEVRVTREEGAAPLELAGSLKGPL